MMMKEVPNIISIPILCYDNDAQVPCVAETMSSYLYVNKFGHKETLAENYKSRILGRILSNSGRYVVDEISLAMDIHYSRECVTTCDLIVVQENLGVDTCYSVEHEKTCSQFVLQGETFGTRRKFFNCISDN
ncbi:hypothetical protein MKX03_010789 [Papaver bracteatum]|nr:hypothetical protein MKX03_010789 [Papaver bracteatum]